MSDEYQLRKDIDTVNKFAYDINNDQLGLVNKDNLIDSINELLLNDSSKKLDKYYDQSEVDSLIEDVVSGDIDLDGYVTTEQLNTALSSYVTSSYASLTYSEIGHTHSNYVDRSELSDLDIELSTLELVPYSDNINGVMCFNRISERELDIDLDMDLMNNGYLKIFANLIEITEDNNNGTSS